METFKEHVNNSSYYRCKEQYKGNECDGLIKPDIVFFGEEMP